MKESNGALVRKKAGLHLWKGKQLLLLLRKKKKAVAVLTTGAWHWPMFMKSRLAIV